MQQEVTHRPHGDLMDPRIMTLAAQSLAYVGRNYSGVATCYRGGQREPPPRKLAGKHLLGGKLDDW